MKRNLEVPAKLPFSRPAEAVTQTINRVLFAYRKFRIQDSDGSNRVCVDFRKLNKITEVDPEPMTTDEDLFRRLSGMKYLSKIDLTKEYWQTPVAPEDVYKTVFLTPRWTM